MRKLFLFGCFFPFLCSILLLPSAAQIPNNWHWRNPLPQGNDLRAGTYGNGTTILVGDAGALVTSVVSI